MTNQELFENVINDMTSIEHWTPTYGWVKHSPSYAYIWCRIADYVEYHTEIISTDKIYLAYPSSYKQLRKWEKQHFEI